ncbi:MAG: pantoate--beta-alanine ligase [Bacteroidales bacterium]|nr:pantoate--beta-alanine ligase [Bacteroidales bacterium]
MKQITTATALEAAVKEAKQQHLEIGLVPTMGALHEGHLSLIERALKENDLVVVSLFVNPIQFNNKEDLEKYPRTIDKDLELIRILELGIRNSRQNTIPNLIAFTPTVDEMYPQGEPKEVYHFGPIEEVMEGPRRPGHFSGVAVVVRRLFDLAQPTRAYFGEKDYQQIAVIRNLLEQIKYPIELIPCPIVRADDGLALSSRNMRLSPEARAMAPAINATLEQAAEMAEYEEVDDVKEWVLDTLSSYHEVYPAGELNTAESKSNEVKNDSPNGLKFEPEYFEIVDAITLQPINSWDDAKENGAVGCIAVWLDGIRLIDIVKF